jgi:hypothetical protein
MRPTVVAYDCLVDTKRMAAFLLEWVSPFLRDRGFRRRGQQYWAKQGENSIFIRFEHRGDFFTCDVGVVSALLIATMTEWEPPEHWTVRLGPVALGYDKWWDLAEDDAAVAADFLPALEKGIEHITPMSSDAGLRDALLRDATTDRRGMIPMYQRWLIVLVGAEGLPDWAIGLPIRLRDGSLLHLELPGT